MNPSPFALLLLLFTACASTPPPLGSSPDGMGVIVATVEQPDGEASCLALQCSEGTCVLLPCPTEDSGSILLTRGTYSIRTRPNPQRYWGAAQPLPHDSQRVFEIPWGSHDRLASLEILKKVCAWPPGRYVKHHIFPQAPDLALWFEINGIDIHAYTLIVLEAKHLDVHGGGPRGGLWNAAWRAFTRSRERATVLEIWRHAFKLIHEFGLDHGPFVPYRPARCLEIPPPPPPEAPLCDCSK